jgi:endoglucanase
LSAIFIHHPEIPIYKLLLNFQIREMRFIIFVCLLCSGVNASSQQYLHADGKKIVDGQNREVILRGIGIGGWMLQEPYMLQLSGVAGTQHEIKNKILDLIGPENTDVFYNKWLNNFLTEKDIAALAKWGFNSIRLPMHYRLFTLSIQEEPDSLTNNWVQ